MREDKHYQYKVFERGLEEYVAGLKNESASLALRKLKFMVLATAWTDFHIWDEDVDKEQAMAWAWEDMVMAFKGFGESVLTGAVMSLWTSIPDDEWETGRKAINKAVCGADDETPKVIARRYLLHYRVQTVRTPDMGFNLPAIVPTHGNRLRTWATKNGMDPDEVETQMCLVEEYERMGLIDLGRTIKFFTGPPFTPENVKTPASPAIEDPERALPAKPPKLILLPGGSG
jgi:hypothetical protein